MRLSVRLGRVEGWSTDSVVPEGPVLFIHLSGDMEVSREAPRPSTTTQRGSNERSGSQHVLNTTYDRYQHEHLDPPPPGQPQGHLKTV